MRMGPESQCCKGTALNLTSPGQAPLRNCSMSSLQSHRPETVFNIPAFLEHSGTNFILFYIVQRGGMNTCTNARNCESPALVSSPFSRGASPLLPPQCPARVRKGCAVLCFAQSRDSSFPSSALKTTDFNAFPRMESSCNFTEQWGPVSSPGREGSVQSKLCSMR